MTTMWAAPSSTLMSPSGGKVLNGQDAKALVAEMTATLNHAQESLNRMQSLWNVILPTALPSMDMPSEISPSVPSSSDVEGMPRNLSMLEKGYQMKDLGSDLGLDLDKTCSGPAPMGTPASVPTGDLLYRQLRAPVDLMKHPSVTKDSTIQEPPGLMKPLSKQPSQGASNMSSLPSREQFMMNYSNARSLQKFDSVGSMDLSHSLSLGKYNSVAGMSTAAQTEEMDGDLDRSLDELSDGEKQRLTSLAHIVRHPAHGETYLSKSMSEPVARNVEQYRKLGASSRDARVMDMMGPLIDEAMFSTRNDTLCKDSLYERVPDAGFNSKAFGHDQISYDIKVPQFTSIPVRQQQAGGVSPQPAATAPAVGQAMASMQGADDVSDAVKPEDGTVPTVGSRSHASGTCKPCLFWYQDLCHKGWRCSFCHIPHNLKTVSKVRPSKKTRNLLQQGNQGPTQTSRPLQSEAPMPVGVFPN